MRQTGGRPNPGFAPKTGVAVVRCVACLHWFWFHPDRMVLLIVKDPVPDMD